MSEFPNTLLKHAEKAARQGVVALRKFWGRQNHDGLELLAPDKERLIEMAEAADKEMT